MLVINGKPVDGTMICARNVHIAVSNADFFDKMPEFIEMKDDIKISKGGGRPGMSISDDACFRFSSIAASLPEERMKVLFGLAMIPTDKDVYGIVRGDKGQHMIALVRKNIKSNETTEYSHKVSGMDEAEGNRNSDSAHKEEDVKNSSSTILGKVHIEKAISDEGFFDVMPEFAQIKDQIGMMNAGSGQKKGCSPCMMRRIHASIDNSFMTIASRLPPERSAVLKDFLGIDKEKTMIVRVADQKTRMMSVVKI